MPISTFLNGSTPSRLRGLQWLALSDTGNVLTRTYTSDSGGGATQTWAPGAVVSCKTEPIANRTERSLTAGRIDERSTHIITVPAGTSVEADDRFAVTGRGTFEVTGVRRQTAEWVRELEVVFIS